MKKVSDEQLSELIEFYEYNCGNERSRGTDVLAALCELAELRKMNRWIPTFERYPNPGDTCLVWVIDDNSAKGGYRTEYPDVWDYDPKHQYWHGTEEHGVSHWRPLPPLPKQEGK